MCNPASFVVTKSKVFWSKTSDSHDQIILEHNLGGLDDLMRMNLVRVEISPPFEQYNFPISEWIYHVDQDVLPEWYDKDKVKSRCFKELVNWLAYKVVLPGQKVFEIDRPLIACYGEITYISKNACVSILGEEASVHELTNNAIVNTMIKNAFIYYVGQNATVEVMHDDSSIGCISGDAQVLYMDGKAKIRIAKGYTRIRTMREFSRVIEMIQNSVVQDIGDNSGIGRMYGKSAVCYLHEEATIIGAHEEAIVNQRNKCAIDITHGAIVISNNEGKVELLTSKKVDN